VFFNTRLLHVLVLCVAACGGDDVGPELIPGGGVMDPGIDGTLYVHVIDEDTDEVISGAEVSVGEVSGETDADGLYTVEDVDGPQTVTVTRTGYTAATWVGVDGANITVPLSPREAPELLQGTVSGTIDGFLDIPVPAARANIAIVNFTANHDDDDPANDIQQPEDPSPNVCVNGGGDNPPPCEWTVRTRTGQMTMFAYLGTIDAGMNVEITGFAYATGVEVEDGEDVDGVELTIVDDSDLTFPDVSLPSAPSGTDVVAAAVRIDLGDDGRLVVPVAGDILPFDLPVPDAALFADDASYELLGFAAADAPGAAASITLERGVESVDELSPRAFLAVPEQLSTDGTTYSFEAVSAATLHLFSVQDADDTTVWGAAIFDGSTEVTIPDAALLPDGTLRFGVQALELPDVDLQDFEIDLVDQLDTRVSSDAVTFSN
jgi:hypothetical protein